MEIKYCMVSLYLLTGYFAGKIFMSMFLAKSSAVVAFTLVYVFTAEMFPTTIRLVVRASH